MFELEKSTVVECLERFVGGAYTIFEVEYLRRPNKDNTLNAYYK